MEGETTAGAQHTGCPSTATHHHVGLIAGPTLRAVVLEPERGSTLHVPAFGSRFNPKATEEDPRRMPA